MRKIIVTVGLLLALGGLASATGPVTQSRFLKGDGITNLTPVRTTFIKPADGLLKGGGLDSDVSCAYKADFTQDGLRYALTAAGAVSITRTTYGACECPEPARRWWNIMPLTGTTTSTGSGTLADISGGSSGCVGCVGTIRIGQYESCGPKGKDCTRTVDTDHLGDFQSKDLAALIEGLTRLRGGLTLAEQAPACAKLK